MTDVAAPIAAPAEPEAVALPTPISVEPRVAPAGEAAEIARQAEEAKLPKGGKEPVKAEAKVDEPKKLSARDAIRAAREKVEAEPASPLKTDPKTAEPAAKAAEPAPAKPDSAKTAEPAKAEPAVMRAPDGKFVSTDPTKAAEANAAKAEPVKEAPKAAEPAKPSFTASAPPARFADAAKAKWAEAPEEVRAETERAITELTKGFEKHKAAAERDASLAEFHEMAGKSQKQLKDVVAQYVGMENALRADPVKGFEAIAQNLGIPVKDIAAKILNQTPDAAASAADATIIELRSEIADLKKGFGEIHAERTQAKTDSTTEAVQKFAADPAHSRFDELSDDIAFFLKTRCPDDLAKAYELAERLNPVPTEAKPESLKEAAVASSAPAATNVTPITAAPASTAPAKSIAGAPPAGSDPARKQPSSSIKEALKRARAAAG